jgi:hypothetical protein
MFCSDVLLDERQETDIDRLYDHYTRLEHLIRVENADARTTYRSPVNFIESMQRPRHRWFPYKEGFSPSFVRQFIEEFDPTGGPVFDPFSGSGTTPIVAAEMGRRSVGMDVSPLTSFIANAKTIGLSEQDAARFDRQIDDFAGAPLMELAEPPQNETVQRYFLPHYLDALLRVKAYFADLEDPRFRDLFKLAFLAAIEPFSTHRKAGNGVKRKTRSSFEPDAAGALQHVRGFISDQLRLYLSDIKCSVDVSGASFRQVTSLDDEQYSGLDSISCLLTSPPYANCFDYSKIYLSELWLGDFFVTKADHKQFRQSSVRSHVHSTWDDRHDTFGSAVVENLIREHIEAQDLWSPRIGSMLAGYFQDLGKLLATVKPRLERGAHLGFVVGNSFYGGVAVATDLLLAEVGLNLGYDVQEVRVYRGVIPSSQQYRLLGDNRKYMRESLVILRSS